MPPPDRHPPRLSAVQRSEERVTPLELFFDLVFVLALTQCAALMAAAPEWEGLGQGLLVLGVLWWAWVGYAWLTSVVNPEEGAVRMAMFVAMAAFLVASLGVPEAFGDEGLTLAVAYGVVRLSQIALFALASRDDPALRRSVTGLGVSTAVGVSLLTIASFLDGAAQGSMWALALLLDMAGPFFFGAEGWRLVPGHFAERHGLVVIIALGESIVAIGVGAGSELTTGVIGTAVVGVGLAAAMWWSYFDVIAIAASQSFGELGPGKQRNEMARDSYSYLHLPMVAGIVLVALGLKKTLEHVDDPLAPVPLFALVGGAAIFLLGQVAFRLRLARRLSAHRMAFAAVLLAVWPVAEAAELAALAVVAITAGVFWALIVYEVVRFSAVRDQIRHEGPAAAEPGGS